MTTGREQLTVAKLVAILQRMDAGAPVVLEGSEDEAPAVGISRTFGPGAKVIIRREGGSCGDELPILRR